MKRWMALCLFACACGSSSSNPTPDSGTPHGSGTFTGTVNGHALTVSDAVFGIDPGSKLVTLVASDQTNLCTLLGGTTFPGGTVTVLGTALINYSAPPPPSDVVVGDYAWFALTTGAPLAGKWWDGVFALPTSCTTAVAYPATGGTISVTQVGTTSGTHLKATYTNLTFDGGTLNGNVDGDLLRGGDDRHPSCGAAVLARPPALE